MQKTAKILIIGAGSIGLRHLRNLAALGYKNLAVCDPDKKRLNAVRNIGNFPLYQDFSRALKKEKPAIVFICTPTNLHIRQANLALNHGADVFMEKPLSYSMAGVDSIIKKVGHRKRTVMVACNFRFNKGWRALKSSLDSGRFGRPLLARVAAGYYLPTARKGRDYRKIYAAQKLGGGVILDSGSHVVDYLSNLFGKIKSGAAYVVNSRSLGIASEEAAYLVFRHESGLLSSVSIDYISKKSMHRVEIVTTRGILTWSFIEDSVFFEDGTLRKIIYQGRKDVNPALGPALVHKGGVNQMFVDELRHFLECVQKRKKPLQDLRMAKDTLATLLKIKRPTWGS